MELGFNPVLCLRALAWWLKILRFPITPKYILANAAVDVTAVEVDAVEVDAVIDGPDPRATIVSLF